MGTSLSGLTPATTFDGLLKVGDNEPLDGTLKAISTGDGTDTILNLSTTAFKIGGDVEIDSSGLNSLIVKRNGSELLKTDGSGLNGGITFTGNLANKFSVGVKGNDFNIWDGSYLGGGDLRFSILADGKTGIGDQTPTAKLHIKGSGATSATTSLLVQNSGGDDILKVADNGISTFAGNNGSVPAGFELQPNTSTQPTWGPKIYSYYDNDKWLQIYKGSSFYTFGDSGLCISSASTTPAARLHVKGSGATSATTALLVQNSAGTEHLKVTDDGVTNVRSALNVNHPSVSSRFIGLAWGSISANSTNDELSLYGGGSTLGSIMYLNASGKSSAPAAMGMKTNGMLVASAMVQSSFAPDASAQLQVDSTTKGFLPPRMAEGERDAISTPAAGLMVYNTDTNQMNYWNGTAWIAF